MAKEQSVARKPSRSKGDTQKKSKPAAKPASKPARRSNGDQAVSSREKELAGYLQKRIKPNLNSGAIPLLARSIAKEIAHQEQPANGSKAGGADDKSKAESDDKPKAASDDKPESQSEEQPKAASDDKAQGGSDDTSKGGGEEKAPDFEADMHELQAELGDDWILRFSVHGDDAWLTAEMEDGSQRIEAPTAATIADAVALLNEAGGRSG